MSAEKAGGSKKVPRRHMLQAMGAASAALVPGVAGEAGRGDARSTTVPYSALSVRGLAAPSAQAQPLFADVYHLICGEDREKWPTLSCSAADQTVQLRTSLGAVTILTGTAPAERLRITPEGNIGIGTASPTAKLHVAGSFSASGPLDINLNNMLGARPAAAFFTAATAPFAPQGRRMGKNAIGWFRDPQSGQPESEATLWLSGDQGMTFFTQSSPRLRITPEGNVGIGTTEPSESLHVAGNIQLDGALHVRGTSDTVAWLDPAATGTNFHFWSYGLTLRAVNGPGAFGPHLPFIEWRQAGNDVQALFLGYGDTDAGIVDLALGSGYRLSVTGGNVHFAERVGIGTLEPSQALHIVGDVQIDGTLRARSAEIADKKIASGSTDPAEWQPYGPAAIVVHVDTSAAGFTTTPRYVASLTGSRNHWSTTGGSEIYNPTPTEFYIYVRPADSTQLTPEYAQGLGWRIVWIGMEG